MEISINQPLSSQSNRRGKMFFFTKRKISRSCGHSYNHPDQLHALLALIY